MSRGLIILRHPALRLISLAAIASLLAVLALATRYAPTFQARRLQHTLDTVPQEEIPRQMRQVGSLGDEGMAVLVAALGHQRRAVAQAARDELQAQLNRWQMCDSSRSSVKVAMLAHKLAQYADNDDRTAQLAAADLATQMLLWPINTRSANCDRLTADCEQVLRASGKRLAPMRRSPENGVKQNLIRGRSEFVGPADFLSHEFKRTTN